MAPTTPALLEGIDMHYETEHRLVWNERERRTRVGLRELLDPGAQHVASRLPPASIPFAPKTCIRPITPSNSGCGLADFL